SERALLDLLRGLGLSRERLLPAESPATDARSKFDPEARQHRQLKQLIDHTQRLLRESAEERRTFWAKAQTKSPEEWRKSCASYRDYLWDEVLGRFPAPNVPANPRSRRIYDKPKWTGYEVVLDVWPDVF